MESQSKFRPDPKLKLMDQVREVLRYKHYAFRTEQTYCNWILRYIRFHGSTIHPRELTYRDVERFLSDLAVNQKVATSTQNQAFNALLFLYREVLDLPFEGKIQAVRSKKRVLSENVCKSIFFAGRGYKNYFVWLERPDKEGWRHG